MIANKIETALIVSLGLVGIAAFSVAYSYATTDHNRNVSIGGILLMICGITIRIFSDKDDV
jgi:hypothetical protein